MTSVLFRLLFIQHTKELIRMHLLKEIITLQTFSLIQTNANPRDPNQCL